MLTAASCDGPFHSNSRLNMVAGIPFVLDYCSTWLAQNFVGTKLSMHVGVHIGVC